MDKSLFPDSNNQPAPEESINGQRVFWASIVFTSVALISFLFSLFLVSRTPVWQVFVITAITTIALAMDIVGVALIWRGRKGSGLKVLFWSTLITIPPNVLLVTGTTPFLIAIILVVGYVHVFYLQPRGWQKSNQFVPIIASVLMASVEIFQPSFRVNLTNQTTSSGYFGPTILLFLVVSLIALIVRQAWSGNIRVKLVTSFTLIALISVGVVGTVVYINYRNQVRQDIRQRLLNIISITALQQDGDLHAAIQTAEDMQTDAYQKMQEVNAAILKTDRDLAYVFSVRVDENGTLNFVLDNGLEEGYEPLTVGEIYDDPSALLAENALTLDHPIVEDDFYTDEYGTFLSAYAPIYKADGTREGIVGVDITADKVIAQERAVLVRIITTTLITLIIVTLIGLLLGNLFVGPVINLSAVARQIAEGDLGARAHIETTDEVGELARDFNIMTSRLQESLQGLERRVADRTRNLELAAEVGRSVSQVRALDVMLKDACDLILKEFNLYYVQVYLSDTRGSTLKLEAGTGNVGAQLVGRGHSLTLDTSSINGRAAIEKRSVVIADTAQSATFRQNPLLPETRGEMAVPLIVADRVVGVLDMQSRESGVLTQDVLPAFEALAGQLAVAIQNANLLAETEDARAEVEKQARRLVRAGWTEHLDAIHKPEQIGFMFDRKEVRPLTESPESQTDQNANLISSSISITGERIGSLVVEMNDSSSTDQAAELVSIVAHQVAQQIENLRLLESAERYRYDAEQAARLQTIEGWQKYIASRPSDSVSYFYDTREVQPLDNIEDNGMFALPLKTRDEKIGTLSVQGLTDKDEESAEIVSAVAERLSAHLENLRLFEETRVGQLELDKRARQLAAVAEVSSVSSRELDIQKMLESVVYLTQRKFGLYHAHIFIYNEQTDMLKIAACGWKEGDEHEGTHGATAIPLAQEKSLVARAARTHQAVIVNDVRNEPGWLPNPLLPDSAAELAVPLIIGDKVLGVLDVQSDQMDVFTDEDASIYATLASQIATALQNAQSFAQAQQQAERESRLNVISQKIQSATTVEAVLQIAARELGHTLGAPLTIAQLGLKETASGN